MNSLRAGAVALALVLAGCASALHPRVGAPSQHRWPQAAEQCVAQPDLPWC